MECHYNTGGKPHRLNVMLKTLRYCAKHVYHILLELVAPGHDSNVLKLRKQPSGPHYIRVFWVVFFSTKCIDVKLFC